MRRALIIFLACLMAVMPARADTLGKRQKTPAEVAESEKKTQVEESDGTPVNLVFKHGKYSLTPASDVKSRGVNESSRTGWCVVVDIRYGHMAVFVYKGQKGHRKLVKAAACSSGANIGSTKTSKTPAGHKVISWKTYRLVYRNPEGKRWQYWSCSMTSGGWGIHSLTYCLKASKYQRKYLWGGKLGAHNSPMCIRTKNDMADFVYSQVPTGTTLYVIR